ncbi:hypothetical protein C8J57DRAFT_1231942 [Mycena rebaudengoi]|nr:hypothetical protein C8J57DRAFT_1231942 [Mycena rebaudengoi]
MSHAVTKAQILCSIRPDIPRHLFCLCVAPCVVLSDGPALGVPTSHHNGGMLTNQLVEILLGDSSPPSLVMSLYRRRLIQWPSERTLRLKLFRFNNSNCTEIRLQGIELPNAYSTHVKTKDGTLLVGSILRYGRYSAQIYL